MQLSSLLDGSRPPSNLDKGKEAGAFLFRNEGARSPLEALQQAVANVSGVGQLLKKKYVIFLKSIEKRTHERKAASKMPCGSSSPTTQQISQNVECFVIFGYYKVCYIKNNWIDTPFDKCSNPTVCVALALIPNLRRSLSFGELCIRCCAVRLH